MFIVFEGIDGSGKTTVSNRVAKKLRETGLSVEHLREGGKFSSPVTQAIREFGRDVRNLDLTPNAEFFLYVTRDVQLLDEMTRPALGKADVVIADRFLYSAEVLGRFGRGLSEAWVKPILEAAAGGLVPDLVVLIDVDPQIARARRRVAKLLSSDKKPPSRKGLSGVGIQQRFRAGYRELAAREPKRWVVVDNDQNLDATVDKVFTLLHDAARSGVPAAMDRLRREEITAPHRGGPSKIATTAHALEAFLDVIDRRAEGEPAVAAYLLNGLHGAGIDERRRRLASIAPELIINGLYGLIDPVSWDLRAALAGRFPDRVARSLCGLARLTPQAAAMRATLCKIVPIDVMSSLDGADTDEAWTMRDEVFPLGPDVVASSLIRLGTPRAWQVRDKWLAQKGGDALYAVYQDVRVICKSITGLDDDRSWEVRKAARDVAPTAAIASLSGVTSDKAWKWRERYLERAPKPVFGTLFQSDDSRAWDMRQRMVALCKEAVDSMVGLDGPPAWRLRKDSADLWPSTVVKSLGPLATTPQGTELVERQLRRFPDNLSLLKHAAAIAAGCVEGPDESSG